MHTKDPTQTNANERGLKKTNEYCSSPPPFEEFLVVESASLNGHSPHLTLVSIFYGTDLNT